MAEIPDEQKIQDSISSPPIEIGATLVPDSNAASKEPVLYDLEEDAIRCDPEKEMTVLHREKKSNFDKSQQLYMIQKLLPVMTKMNQEKITEFDSEAKNKGFLNLGAYLPNHTKNLNLGSYVSIYNGGLDNPMDADLLSKLHVHACDMVLPNIKENIKAAKKKKITKKCHWCGLRSFCVLIKCLACNKNFFCEECVNTRYYCKKTIERQCPVCQWECPCRAYTRGKPKQVKTKEPVIHDLEKDIIVCDPEMEMDVSDHEKTYAFDISQHLHIIQELLPVMTKLSEEKIIELDIEASNKGLCHDGLEVQIAKYTQKECSFCKACILDAHRSCDFCSFMLCLVCCHDLRDIYLHSSLEILKETRIVRSKSSKNTSWRFPLDRRISCPPKNLVGCKRGLLQSASFYSFCLTKDLEEIEKQILCNFQLKRLNGLSDYSPCLSCNENGEGGVYIATKLEFKDNNLEHFMKHWESANLLLFGTCSIFNQIWIGILA